VSANNQRQEARLYKAETIFIETQRHYSENGDGASTLLIWNSVDLSANGIQAQIDETLPLNAIYPVCVEITETLERLCLVGQVKWIRPNREGEGYNVGIMFFESDDTDIERWKLHIAKQLSNS
jgi:hypothetical protein